MWTQSILVALPALFSFGFTLSWYICLTMSQLRPTHQLPPIKINVVIIFVPRLINCLSRKLYSALMRHTALHYRWKISRIGFVFGVWIYSVDELHFFNISFNSWQLQSLDALARLHCLLLKKSMCQGYQCTRAARKYDEGMLMQTSVNLVHLGPNAPSWLPANWFNYIFG